MGMCVAGGAYLPVMTDTVLMTEGSGLFLAGPSLVQAAIGQKTGAEELGGARCTRRSPEPSTLEDRTTRLAWRDCALWLRRLGYPSAREVFSRVEYDPARDAPRYAAEDCTVCSIPLPERAMCTTCAR
jgi:3-methylcrotonyl-CoA carboxylase beta subunit